MGLVCFECATALARSDSADSVTVRRMTLNDCIHTALVQNRALQIERLQAA